jgi:predicted ribosomally synthesized peptide with SipW-like signal peptide
MNVSKTRLALAGIGLVAVVAATTAGTTAYFTDQDAIDANAFTNGTIVLSTNPTTALVTYSAMMPGDSVTNPVTITTGATSQALRYSISSSATDADGLHLKDQLVLAVKTVDVTTPGVPCDDFDGTSLYSGDLDSSAGKIIGDSTSGAQAGDRALAGNTSEVLCFRVSLPTATGNTYKLATTTATFTFDSEQTKNNP